jgi:hypothetical protein
MRNYEISAQLTYGGRFALIKSKLQTLQPGALELARERERVRIYPAR